MNDYKIYDTENESDMLELEGEYSETQINKAKNILKQLVKDNKEKKKHEFQSGECCPICGSINYYQSGTCKTCRDCAFAGGCG